MKYDIYVPLERDAIKKFERDFEAVRVPPRPLNHYGYLHDDFAKAHPEYPFRFNGYVFNEMLGLVPAKVVVLAERERLIAKRKDRWVILVGPEGADPWKDFEQKVIAFRELMHVRRVAQDKSEPPQEIGRAHV